jgi:hypothetical protein
MKKSRQISLTVNKMSIADANRLDDVFWASTSIEFRLQELADLIKLNYGVFGRIKKEITKGSINKNGEV